MASPTFVADGSKAAVRYLQEVLSQRDRLLDATHRGIPDFVELLNRYQPSSGFAGHDELRRAALAEAAADRDTILRDAIYAVYEAHNAFLAIARVRGEASMQDCIDTGFAEASATLMDLLPTATPQVHHNRTSQEQPESPVRQAGNASGSNRLTKRRKPRATINQLMLSTLQEHPDAPGWTSTEWAKFLGRSKSAVTETPAWKTFESTRLGIAAQNARDRRGRNQPRRGRSHNATED